MNNASYGYHTTCIMQTTPARHISRKHGLNSLKLQSHILHPVTKVVERTMQWH